MFTQIATPVSFIQEKPFGAPGPAISMFSGVYMPILQVWTGKIAWKKSFRDSVGWLQVKSYRFNSGIGVLERAKGYTRPVKVIGELSPSGNVPNAALSIAEITARLEAWLKTA